MLPAATAHELSLRDHLQIIRRRKVPLAVFMALAVIGSVVVSSLQASVYFATAEVLLKERRSETIFDPGTGQRNDPRRTLQTEIRILRSEPVRLAVEQRLGSAPEVTATSAGETDVILVGGMSTSPWRAAEIANAYALSYIEFKRKQAVEDVLAASQEIQSKVNELQAQIETSTSDAPRERLIQQQALFKNKLDQLQVDAALKTGGAQLVTRARAPTEPVSPKPLRNALLALALGALLGLGVVFLLEHLDDSIKTQADLQRAAPSLPVIATIPAVANWRNRDEPRLVSLTEPSSPAAEAYRSLRTSVHFLGLDRQLTSLQVSSASADVGKTTTAANLALALARAGEEVLVLSCDLRRPRIHEFFGLSNRLGVSSVLVGDTTLPEAVQQVRDVEGLFLLSSGPAPANPAELLASSRMTSLLAAVREQHYFLVVDAPPILPVTDALVLAKHVDATLLVTGAAKTTRRELARAVQLFAQVQAPLLGCVLNGVNAEGEYGYPYTYGYRSAGAVPPFAPNGNGGTRSRAGKRSRVKTRRKQ